MRRNTLIAGGLVACVAGMAGLSFAAVPLYRMFCAATGYAGTPQIRGAAGPGATAGTIEVRFDANTSPALPWRFAAGQASVTVPLGEDRLAFYTGRSQSDQPVTGVATYNVTPEKVGRYFHKTACFCFDEQTLAPRQEMQFPLSFWVDPAIATDPDTRDVHSITLSYTFFRSLDDAAARGGLDKAGPHVGPAAVGPRADAGSGAGSGLSPPTISR
ncbi:MAG: cytochrome c oxidase assembly protein [Acetobacteraceae bacterium]